MIGQRVFMAGVVALAAATIMPSSASAQEKASGALRSDALELSIAGSVHTLFSTTSVSGSSAPTLWELSKVRLDLRAKVSDQIGARIQPEFTGSRVTLKNAYVSFRPSSGHELRVGHARKPFGIKISGKTRLFIDRGARFRDLAERPFAYDNLISSLGYVDRDVGIQVEGKPARAPLGLAYTIGLFNGPAHGAITDEVTFQFSGRATIEPAPDLRFGLSLSHRDFAPPPANPGDGLRGGAAWTVDLEYGRYAPGLHLAAEYAQGAADPFSDSGSDFQAFAAWAGYRTERIGSMGINIEPIARVSHGRRDADAALIAAGEAGGVLFTPGINLYFSPLNRIMVNYDIWKPRGGTESVRSLKVKFQVEF